MVTHWLATRTVGPFRLGHVYTREQLGVTGRMAAMVGFLTPTDAPAPKRGVPVKAKAARRPRKSVSTKGWADGEPGGAESGKGPDDIAEPGT